HQLQQFLGGDRARALFLDLGLARRANTQLQVRRGYGEPAALGLYQQVGQDRYGRLPLDHTLRGAELIQQRGLGNAEFHRVIFVACGSWCSHVSAQPLSGAGTCRCLLLRTLLVFRQTRKLSEVQHLVEMREISTARQVLPSTRAGTNAKSFFNTIITSEVLLLI